MAIVGSRFQGGFLGTGSSVGLRKTDTELKAKETGKIKELNEKWFGYDLTPHAKPNEQRYYKKWPK